MQLIDLKAQQARLQPQINQRIASVLAKGNFIMGEEVLRLEAQLAQYVDIEHCISCANGTDALQVALMALDIGPGDIVFTTAFSFFATAEVISLVGATPYFVDIDEQTFNICPQSLSSAIAEAKNQSALSPKAVIAVDLFGLPANYSALQKMCSEYGLLLIEDAAQGFGGSMNEARACRFGDIATTSFFPAKPLGCYGDGGAIFTKNDSLAERCRSIRLHGKGKHKYQNVRVGLNSRLDTLQAAILLEKLSIFEDECNARDDNASAYTRQLNHGFVTPKVASGYTCSWAQYTLWHRTVPREKLLASLGEAGIPSAIYYPTPLNQQPGMQNALSLETPISNQLSQKAFSIPVHPYLSADDKQLIIETLNACTD